MNSLLKRLGLLLLAAGLPFLLASCASQQAANPPASLYANASPLDLRLSKGPYPYPLKEFKTSL